MMTPRAPYPWPIQFEGWRVPPGFESDGCTLARDGHRNRYTPACVLHDFMMRHAIIPAKEANALLRRHLLALGASRFRAWCYWAGAAMLRPLFTRTLPLPYEWRDYVKKVH